MGQQQLLLLVLTIVLVGVAVAAGIDAFSENQKKTSSDLMLSEAVQLAGEVQAWKTKPAAFGGLGDNDLSTISIGALGYETTIVDGREVYLTDAGAFWVDSPNNGCVDVWGATPDGLANTPGDAYTAGMVNVQIWGPDANDITTHIDVNGTGTNCAVNDPNAPSMP